MSKDKPRDRGEGGIYQRADGLWAASIELPAHGGDRRRKVMTSKDKGTAIRKLNAAKAELAKSGDLATSVLTVGQWFDRWLKHQQGEIRPATWATYESIARNHIIPAIGNVRLDRLTAAHVQRTTTASMQKGPGTDKGLSSTSALSVHRILSSALTDAEREGRIARNPAKLTDAPRRDVTMLETLTVKEAAKLIQSAKDGTDQILWATFLLTGARRGELLGLTWGRVTDVLDLSWQLQRHGPNMTAPADYEHERVSGNLYLTRPKSKAGWRIIPLVDPLKTMLERWRTVAPDSVYVFPTKDGKPRDPDNVSHAWTAALTGLGIKKHVRLHDLRHTAVDILYEAGVPENVIIEIVGHSSRAMTRAYKSRGNRPQLTDAMMRMSALLTASTADSPRSLSA